MSSCLALTKPVRYSFRVGWVSPGVHNGICFATCIVSENSTYSVPFQYAFLCQQHFLPLSALSPRTQAVICVSARCRPAVPRSLKRAVRMHIAAIHVTRIPPNSQGLPSVTRPGPYPGPGSNRSDDPPPHRSTKVHFVRLLIPVGLFIVFGGSIAA